MTVLVLFLLLHPSLCDLFLSLLQLAFFLITHLNLVNDCLKWDVQRHNMIGICFQVARFENTRTFGRLTRTNYQILFLPFQSVYNACVRGKYVYRFRLKDDKKINVLKLWSHGNELRGIWQQGSTWLLTNVNQDSK